MLNHSPAKMAGHLSNSCFNSSSFGRCRISRCSFSCGNRSVQIQESKVDDVQQTAQAWVPWGVEEYAGERCRAAKNQFCSNFLCLRLNLPSDVPQHLIIARIVCPTGQVIHQQHSFGSQNTVASRTAQLSFLFVLICPFPSTPYSAFESVLDRKNCLPHPQNIAQNAMQR